MRSKEDSKAKHWAVGVWVDDPEDPVIEWHVNVCGGGLVVSGVDCEDGEAFEISDIVVDENGLMFTVRMPSTGHVVRHSMFMGDDGVVFDTLTWRRPLHRTE